MSGSGQASAKDRGDRESLFNGMSAAKALSMIGGLDKQTVLDLSEQLLAAIPTMTSDEVLKALGELDDIHLQLARTDAAAFCSYVLRDEQTGRPIELAPIHESWHRLANQHRRLLLWSHVEAGKTTQMSVGRVLWELGRNPALRVVIVSNTDGQAQKICQALAQYIEESEALHRVFPGLKPDKRAGWSGHELFVERDTIAKDPSIRSCGIHGNILGARIDLLILDDLLDYENVTSPTQRDQLWDWYFSTLDGRLTADSRVVCIGTAWHPEDVMHRFAKHPGWHAVRYPVVDPITGESRWPSRWPLSRIAEKKLTTIPIEFARQFLCQARNDDAARFKREWIDQCLKRGEGRQLAWSLQRIPAGYATYTGVDLGVGLGDEADLTVLFTICVHPNGDREILCIESGRWAAPDIIDRICDTHMRYGSIVLVENNAAQEYIAQFTRHRSAVPVKSFTTTGQNSRHPEFGVESLAVELANAKWIIPSRRGRAHPEIEAWIGDLLYYDPNAHAGDRLMASWFAREGVRMKVAKTQFGKLDLQSR